MSNEVSLQITGDASDLEKAIADATKQVQSLDTTLSTAGSHASDSAARYADLGEKADGLATKSSAAYGAVGALGSGLALAGLGGSGFATALNSVGLGFDALSGIGDTVKLIKDSEIATKAAEFATKAWSIAQAGLNLVMDANPLILVGIAVAGLIAAIVLIATKTDWFQRIWHAAWGAAKTAAVDVWNWLKALPGNIEHVFAGLADAISAPFRTAFNLVADAWNHTVGSLHFNIPSWVPGLGGKGFDVPDLPHFDQGGVVPGAIGAPTLAVVHGGETVTPPGRGGRVVVELRAGDSAAAALMALFRGEIATRYGGDVQMSLGGAR